MRWDMGRRSDNVEDRRGSGPSRRIRGGGIGMLLLILVGMYFGIDPAVILSLLGGGGMPAVEQAQAPRQQTPPDHRQDRLADFVSVVLADTEDTWRDIFRHQGATYQEPRLVLFSGAVDSACGFARSASGPFYCPGDNKVYIDLAFYDDLKQKMHAPGDFAQAYVVAHEIGHHVQNLLGISDKVHAARQRVSQREENQLSVRLELQADCFAGIWAHHADRSRGVVEPGDIEEALNAASQIGDDRLQRQAHGRIVPDSFTHGTSEQRMRWFRRGFQSGRMQDCDTFAAQGL